MALGIDHAEDELVPIKVQPLLNSNRCTVFENVAKFNRDGEGVVRGLGLRDEKPRLQAMIDGRPRLVVIRMQRKNDPRKKQEKEVFSLHGGSIARARARQQA
jgi:hypothetical protein